MPGTPKQDRFMAAVAHGWRPSRVRAPSVSVAKEWTADAFGPKERVKGLRRKRFEQKKRFDHE